MKTAARELVSTGSAVYDARAYLENMRTYLESQQSYRQNQEVSAKKETEAIISIDTVLTLLKASQTQLKTLANQIGELTS